MKPAAPARLPASRFESIAERLRSVPSLPRLPLGGDGEKGADLWVLAALAAREDSLAEETLYWEQKALERAASEPERSLKDLREAWRRLSDDEFSAERAAILMLAGQIPGGIEAFENEAQEELRRPVDAAPPDANEDQARSTRPAEAAPVAAHALLLRSEIADERAISATIEALNLQPSGFVRGALLTQFRELRTRAWGELGDRLRSISAAELSALWEQVNR